MICEVIGRQLSQERSDYFPSCSKAGDCPRKLTYWRLGVPESDPIPERMGVVWSIGDAIESALDQALSRSGIPIHSYQRKIRIPFRYGTIFGRIDRIIEPDTVLDYKSINRYGFDEVLDSGPKREHVLQVNLYLHGLHLEGENRFTRGLVLYVNKDNGMLYEATFDYDPQLALESIRLFELVEEHAMAGTLPERPDGFTPATFPCTYCSWRSLCWGNGTFAPPGDSRKIADLSHLSNELIRYLEISAEIRALEKQKERIRALVQAALVDAGAREGFAGGVRARIITGFREKVDLDKIPELFRAAATTVETTTMLRIDPVMEVP